MCKKIAAMKNWEWSNHFKQQRTGLHSIVHDDRKFYIRFIYTGTSVSNLPSGPRLGLLVLTHNTHSLPAFTLHTGSLFVHTVTKFIILRKRRCLSVSTHSSQIGSIVK